MRKMDFVRTEMGSLPDQSVSCGWDQLNRVNNHLWDRKKFRQ